ncbi:kinase-like protein, partial [Melanomma pulvis-pyrius CBS 109.77]
MDARTPTLFSGWKLDTTIHPDGSREHVLASGQTRLWKPVKQLGRGTFGDVWKEVCVSEQPGAVRAVKRIDKRQLRSSDRELTALITFSNSQYPERFISQNPCTELETVTIISQVARALGFMHRNKFVHRDLKPLNILVREPRPYWQVKLADFGICKNTDGTVLGTRQAGTEGYMAPELFDHHDEEAGGYTCAVDIWSLGAVAHCVRTGSPPFRSTRQVLDYQGGRFRFPVRQLAESSAPCGMFIRDAMAALASDRPTIEEILKHPWLSDEQ